MAPQIVFQARGLRSDLRLQVFNTTFDVHSVILKMQPEFFFKFLDSDDKNDLVAHCAEGFRYEWATRVDEEGSGWKLVDARYDGVNQP
jgi:hypothetical protein